MTRISQEHDVPLFKGCLVYICFCYLYLGKYRVYRKVIKLKVAFQCKHYTSSSFLQKINYILNMHQDMAVLSLAVAQLVALVALCMFHIFLMSSVKIAFSLEITHKCK